MMHQMFYSASAFNQDLSGWHWQIDSVTDMSYMFWGAASFDQDLGWCVGDDVELRRRRSAPAPPGPNHR